MRRRTHRLGVAIAIVLVLPLAACTPGDDESLTEVTAEALEVPEVMLPTQAQVVQRGELLTAGADLPFAFGGSVTEPAESAEPAVWVSDDAADWERTVVDPDFKGSFEGVFAGSSERAALGGMAWNDRDYRSVLWASDDRTTWNPVTLPDTFASSHTLTVLAVVDATIFGIGVSLSGEAAGFAVSGDTAAEISLPEPKEGDLLSPLLLTGEGTNLLLLASPGPEGEPAPTVAFVSADAGGNWSDPVEIADARSGVEGVTWTGSEYVATGWGPESEVAGATYRPRAWASADGIVWTTESVPAAPDEGAFRQSDIADLWLGAPTAADGLVTAIAANVNSAVSGLYTRSAPGEWSFTGVTGVNEASGESGIAVPVAGDLDLDATTVVLLGTEGHLRTGLFTESGYRDGTVLADRQAVAVVDDVFPASDGLDLILRTRIFEVGDDLSWRNTSETSLARYTGGDAVAAVPWEPQAVEDLVSVTMATDADGAQVTMGSLFPSNESAIVARGYHRSSDDAEWVPMTGFPDDGATLFRAAVGTDTGWVAVGSHRIDSVAGSGYRASAWESSDGVAWTRADGEFGDGLLESELVDVCVLPDGTPLGIGWVEVASGAYRMAAWSPSGESWTLRDLGEFGDREGYGTTCANDADGVVVSGTVGGRAVLLRTTTGDDWAQVFRADRGADLHSPVAVPGGFAAAGSWAVDETGGPVIWLSRDGAEWTPVAVAAKSPTATTSVIAHGPDLIVGLPAAFGQPLVVVRDIEGVIADVVPQGAAGGSS